MEIALYAFLAMMFGNLAAGLIWHSWCKFRWDHLGWRPLFYNEPHLNSVADAHGYRLFDSALIEPLTRGKTRDECSVIRTAIYASHRAAIEEYLRTFAKLAMKPVEVEQ